MVDHQLERAARGDELSHLGERTVRPRGVVYDSEGVDEVELLSVEHRGQLLGVRREESDPVADLHDLGALLGDPERLGREVDRRQLGACTGEVDRVGADAAADLEHTLAAPALEVREPRNVRLDEVLPRLDLVEVLARPDGLRRVPDVAGPRIPVALDVGERRWCWRATHQVQRLITTPIVSRSPDGSGSLCPASRP